MMTRSIRLMAVKVRNCDRAAAPCSRKPDNCGCDVAMGRRVDSGLGVHEPRLPGGRDRCGRPGLVGLEGGSPQPALRGRAVRGERRALTPPAVLRWACDGGGLSAS